MIIIKPQRLLHTPRGFTHSELEELLRLRAAGLLQVTAPCLSGFSSSDRYASHACKYSDCQDFCRSESTGRLPAGASSRLSMSELYISSGVPEMLQYVQHLADSGVLATIVNADSAFRILPLCAARAAGPCITFGKLDGDIPGLSGHGLSDSYRCTTIHYIPTARRQYENEEIAHFSPPFAYRTGADLPPEVLDVIVEYGCAGRYTERDNPLETYALVDSRWANLCRPALLEQRLANITSPGVLKLVRRMFEWTGSLNLPSLRSYATKRKFLVSVCPHVVSSPWLHQVPCVLKVLPVNTSAVLLRLNGHILPDIAEVSPYWALPRTLSPDFTSIYTGVHLRNLSASSFDSIVILLARFRQARMYSLRNVTWNPGQDLARIRSIGSTVRLDSSTRIVAAIGCSSNVRLCLRVGLLFSDCPLGGVSQDEMDVVAGLLESLRANVFDYRVQMEWDENNDTVRFLIRNEFTGACMLSLICPRYAGPTDPNVGRHVVALWLSCPSYLIDYMEIQRSISRLSFLRRVFTSFNDVVLMLQVLPMWQGLLRRSEVIFQQACRRSSNCSFSTTTANGTLELHTAVDSSDISDAVSTSENVKFLWEKVVYDGTTVRPTGLTYECIDDMALHLFENQGVCFQTTRKLQSEGIHDLEGTTARKLSSEWNSGGHWAQKYHVFMSFEYPVGGILVPQAEYNTTSPFHPHFPTIKFSQGGTPGVNLQATLRGRNLDMVDGDSRPTTTATSTKIKIRILWPGYMEYNMDIDVQEDSRPGEAEAIPKWKLAMRVAHVVRSFYDGLSHRDCQYQALREWNLHDTAFQRLRLLELHHVFKDSWQPVLVYELP